MQICRMCFRMILSFRKTTQVRTYRLYSIYIYYILYIYMYIYIYICLPPIPTCFKHLQIVLSLPHPNVPQCPQCACIAYHCPLPDPAEVIEAGGVDSQQKTLKAMMFPTMDEADALPSSYITKVLTALGKWSAKLQSLTDFFGGLDPTANTKVLLIFIQFAWVTANVYK